jgi:hypothetical protein
LKIILAVVKRANKGKETADATSKQRSTTDSKVFGSINE